MLQDQVRGNPSERQAPHLPVPALGLLGQWDRAMTQLNVAGELDAGTLAMVADLSRGVAVAKLCAQRSLPASARRSCSASRMPWMALLIEAQRLGCGRCLCAGGLTCGIRRWRRPRRRPARSTSTPFEWITDGDHAPGPHVGGDRQRPLLLGRRSMRIAEVRSTSPSDLRDLVWMPAHLTWANGGADRRRLIPNRYPGSKAQADSDLRPLHARPNGWSSGDTFIGLGQRMLFTDQGEYALDGYLRHLIIAAERWTRARGSKPVSLLPESHPQGAAATIAAGPADRRQSRKEAGVPGAAGILAVPPARSGDARPRLVAQYHQL